MDRLTTKFALLLSVSLLAGCAARHYQPAALDAGATAARFESRTLADRGLRAFEEKNLGKPLPAWPPDAWNLETLSLAALYFSPALDAARARASQADAAVVTAGARPNPTLSVSPGVPSPYLMTLDLAIPIETAGKRGARIANARSLDESARIDLADSAWNVLSGVRSALLNFLFSAQTLETLRAEEQARADQVKILESIQAAGEVPRVDVDLARLELSKASAAVRSAEGQVAEARTVLAAAVGVPLAGLQNTRFLWTDFETPPNLDSVAPVQIERDAVLNRLDVRRSLAQYAAAESALQLEIARQYPDINIGPGYTYEERNSFFTVGISTSIPLFNRNEGPIAEAEARRKEAAAALLETQAQAVAKSERAQAVYSSALKELADAQSSHDLQQKRIEILQRNIRAGTDTRLSLDAAQIELAALARTRLDALAKARRALGDLEDAVQRPLDGEGIERIEPASPLLKESVAARPN